MLSPTHHGRPFFFFLWFAATSGHPPLRCFCRPFICELFIHYYYLIVQNYYLIINLICF
ncbi:hypothetical protein Hanom_Chr02g00116971 [Helianthus anomalus]